MIHIEKKFRLELENSSGELISWFEADRAFGGHAHSLGVPTAVALGVTDLTLRVAAGLISRRVRQLR